MELIYQHILPHLKLITKKKSSNLGNIINEIQNEIKTEFVGVICYLDQLLNLTFSSTNIHFTALHIHIEEEFSDSQKLLLAEYLNIKSFKYYHSTDNQTNDTNRSLIELIATIEAALNRLEQKCPDGASAKNGGNKIWKNWVRDKKESRGLLEFYKRLNINSSLQTKSLFNTKKSFCDSVCHKFEFKPYCISLNSKNKSYNIINATHTLNEIDKIDSELIDEFDLVVLFDCERKSLMSNFSFEEINKWNSDYNTRFSKYLIVTFGKKHQSINNIRNKIDLTKERFKIPNTCSYTVIGAEIDILTNNGGKSSASIEFVSIKSSDIWGTFVSEVNYRELYELRSIKLMNVYSICYSDEIKTYIIEDLFSKKESSELISLSTKMAILELTDEDIDTLKTTLNDTLDLIISSDSKFKVIQSISNTPTIIFDELILRNVKLLSKITNSLGLKKDIKFATWSDLLTMDSNYFLILSYRDQGKYPNYYYPNLQEFELDSEKAIKAILLEFLFGNLYYWSRYYLLKEYHDLLGHPIREKHFEWYKLKNEIRTLKPEQKIDIDWNLESEYTNSEQKESFKIKVKGHKSKTVYSSDLFIISDDNNLSRKVVKTDFLSSFENNDGIVYIQNLDEVQEDINIYEKIVDIKQQEKELEVIRKKFNLGNETAGRLWKVLLKNLTKELGEDKLYIELKQYFETKGLRIVSQFHFKNSWINPQSESIAPLSKRVFIELCEYLKIPKGYFFIIQRIRNASKQSSRQSTRQMNQLLKDLFNNGCFDNDKNARDIINNKLNFYKQNHPLDELGIDENYLADNLVTLVELIKPELKLVALETIEKLYNE